jgi:Predicted glycosyltransferases
MDLKNNKYNLLFFPKINGNINNHLSGTINYFTGKGYFVYYFDIDDRRDLNHTEFPSDFKFIAFNDKRTSFMIKELDEVIIKNGIKDCLLFVEDPFWREIAKSLKEKFGFKIIFYYTEEATIKGIDSEEVSIQDDEMIELSDRAITNSQDLYLKVKQKNRNIELVSDVNFALYIECLIKEIYGLVSIIIVTFNNLDITKQCIESIFRKTAYPNYEIIIVDNQSNDGTIEYLLDLQKNYHNLKVILNEENYGFAKANNIGIAHSKGEYVILLNNDTIVTKGWIMGFVKHLDRNKNLGLIGPVTNYAGNESQVKVTYSSIEDMDSFAEVYTTNHLNELYTNIRMLGMFCVAMKRHIIEEIGYLDECFGLGMFEDDDYSFRIKSQGYQIACAEDVFIHHHGSASFRKLNSDQYYKLFLKNKEIYEKKWNIIWTGDVKRG